MDSKGSYDHILIRDATVLVRVPKGTRRVISGGHPEVFDVRTGVQLREIYPDLQEIELHRGYLMSEESAESVLRSGTPISLDPALDLSKVVTILEIKQRKLDSVVAESILDQVRIIADLLQQFLAVADISQKEEKFWLSQQILTLIRKFSGRELAELEEIVEWFKKRPSKK
ncbi:MAG: hypothetical protein WCG29_04905 [Desulfomonile sp.]|jgi:hypothetical protein|nr:hypothetical protein [Deltaproteobacteria bacterium]